MTELSPAEPVAIDDPERPARPAVTIAAVAYSWHITSDIYGDEGHTYQVVATGDFAEQLSNPEMVHPPLFFVCARLGYMIVGHPWGIRLPSVLFALGTIVLVAIAAKRILGLRYVLAAAAVTASSPFLLDFAAEGRPYALLCLLSIAFVIAFFEFLRAESIRTTAAVAAVAVAGLFTHLAFSFTLVFGAAYYLVTKRRVTRHAAAAVGVSLIVVAILLSFMMDDMAFSMKATSKARESHLNIPNFLSRLPVALTYGFCTFKLPDLGAGRNVTSSMVRDNVLLVSLALLSFAGMVVAVAVAWIKRTAHVGLLACGVIVPILAGIVAGLIGFFYIREKYFAGILGFYLLLIALALVRLAKRRIGWPVVAAYVVVVSVSIGHYILSPNEYSRRVDFSGVNEAIGRRIADGDAVVLFKTLGVRGLEPSQMNHIAEGTIHIIRRGSDEAVSPADRALEIQRQTDGTVFLVSREVGRNFVDPGGDVLRSLQQGRTTEATRFGRNLTLYILAPKGDSTAKLTP